LLGHVVFTSDSSPAVNHSVIRGL